MQAPECMTSVFPASRAFFCLSAALVTFFKAEKDPKPIENRHFVEWREISGVWFREKYLPTTNRQQQGHVHSHIPLQFKLISTFLYLYLRPQQPTPQLAIELWSRLPCCWLLGSGSWASCALPVPVCVRVCVCSMRVNALSMLCVCALNVLCVCTLNVLDLWFGVLCVCVVCFALCMCALCVLGVFVLHACYVSVHHLYISIHTCLMYVLYVCAVVLNGWVGGSMSRWMSSKILPLPSTALFTDLSRPGTTIVTNSSLNIW